MNYASPILEGDMVLRGLFIELYARVFGLLLLTVFCLWTHAAGAEMAPVSVSRTQFILDEGALPPPDSADWIDQTLPDPWLRSRPDFTGTGWYRAQVTLPEAPHESMAMYTGRGGEHVTVFVNGQLVGRTGTPAEGPDLTWKRPLLFTIPPSLLHAGENRLDVRISGTAGWPAGLSGLVVGTEDRLGQEFRKRIIFQAYAPVAIAVAVGLLGLFFLVLWLKRRETLFLLFAMASLFWATRTVWDIFFHTALPPLHWEVLRTTLYVGFVTCLCLFALRAAGAHLPVLERIALFATPLTPPVLYVLSPVFPILKVSEGVLLALILMTVWATVAVVRSALRTTDPGVRILAASAVASFGFGVHDWVSVQESALFDHIRLVPYVVLGYMVVMSWLVTRRFAATFTELEAMNLELDQRVAAKSAELISSMEALSRAKASAEAANHAKSRFLAAASHDLRQPLYALGLFTTALGMRAQTPEISNIATKIERSVEALEKMFNELLDISRLDAGAMEPSFQPVRFRQLADRLIADFAPVAEGKGVRFRVRTADFWLRTDPLMIERALGNLVANAVRYTERGGILIAPRRHHGRLWIQVWDTGIGIDDDDGSRIFDEFFQASNPGRDRTKGLGLGLSIVRRLAGALGEEVRWRSRLGHGSCFEMSVTPTMPPVADESGPVQALPLAAGQHHVVVIEDDQIVLNAVSALLEQWGIEVTGANDLDTALAQLKDATLTPNLIIADVRLAGPASGVSVARAIRRRYASAIPVLLVTGETAREHLAEVLASGWPVLQKPISGSRLYQQVQLMLAPSHADPKRAHIQ